MFNKSTYSYNEKGWHNNFDGKTLAMIYYELNTKGTGCGMKTNRGQPHLIKKETVTGGVAFNLTAMELPLTSRPAH